MEKTSWCRLQPCDSSVPQPTSPARAVSGRLVGVFVCPCNRTHTCRGKSSQLLSAPGAISPSNQKATPCGQQGCNLCNICLQGFKLGKASTRFGPGVYFSKDATKASSYALGTEKKVRTVHLISFVEHLVDLVDAPGNVWSHHMKRILCAGGSAPIANSTTSLRKRCSNC